MGNPTSPAIRVGVNKGKTYYWCSCAAIRNMKESVVEKL